MEDEEMGDLDNGGMGNMEESNLLAPDEETYNIYN